MYNKFNKSLCGCLAASVVFMATPTIVKAQNIDTNDSVKLNTVFINKKPKNKTNAPTILTNSHTTKDIENKQVDNIHDISRLDPVIGYNTRNDSFTMRGLDQNRILTTIDGITIPWLNDGARGVQGGTSTFDFNTLSSLDIVKGADSSLYGTGALGGVVAMRTIDPEDLITNEKNWAALSKGSYDSANSSWRIDQAFAVKANNTYMLLQGGYVTGKQRRNNSDGGGYGTSRILENPADFDQNNLLFKIFQHIDGGHRFGFTAERFNYDNDISTLNASTSTYRAGSVVTEEQKRRERYSLSYDYDGNGDALLDTAHAVIYWQRQLIEETTKGFRLVTPKENYMRDNMMRNTTYGISVNGAKKLEFNEISHTFRFSTDLSQSKFQQYAGGEDTCPAPPYSGATIGCQFLHTNQSDAPNTDSASFGFALEDEIGLFDNRLRITPGTRFDWYNHKPKSTYTYEINPGFSSYPASSSSSRLSPKLRAEYDVNDKLTFYAQWAQAFRAPSATELYLTYTNPNYYYVAGNPNLKPETSNGYDLGAKIGDEHFGGSIGLFTNQYKNFIDTLDLGASREFRLSRRQYMNRNNVRISGLEIKGHWAINNYWHTNFGLTYAEGKDTDSNEYLNTIPSVKGVAGIGYAKEKWGSDLIMTAVAKRNKVASNSDFLMTPGYTLLDLTGWIEPFGKKGPRIHAGIYNIFDKRYWNALDLPSATSSLSKDYYTESGRSFKVSIVQKF